MAESPADRAVPRRWLLLALVAMFVVACDIRPLEHNAQLPVPVETVTAVPIDVDDLIVDPPSSSTDGAAVRSAAEPRR